MFKINRSTMIFIALGLGVVFGVILNRGVSDNVVAYLDRNILTVIGKGFIKLVQFIVVPLVLLSLTLAISGFGDLKKIGRLSAKLLFLYFVTSSISLAIGIFSAKLLQPGVGIEMVTEEVPAFEGMSMGEWFLGILPRNPFEALSQGNILEIIVTALLLGIGISLAGQKGKLLLDFFKSCYEVIIKITDVILYLAPLGVFALMASVIATQGLGIIRNLSIYIFGLAGSLIFVALVMYNLLFLLTGVKIVKFWKAFYPAFAFAFGTASSGASLPLVMANARERYGMKEELVSFAFPFGIAIKKDGAALLQAFSALFVAQMAGITLTPPQMTAVVVSSFLVSFSTAGIPAGGMIMMATVLSAAGLPLEGVLILVGVDRLTDTFRSSLNVIGPAANAAILEQWENKKTKT